MSTTFKYSLLTIILLGSVGANAQNQTNNAAPQAVVTIIGDPVVNQNDFINNNNNPYTDNNTNGPPSQQQMANVNQNIEPSLENGFHIRFDLDSPQAMDRVMASGYMASGGSGKVKKHETSMTERSFNLKKKIKTWLPKHKKKYRPHLCGRF